MAGANNRSAAQPNQEDGILTAEEVASLDLSGVEWAVLSACDTAKGGLSTGESLRRAFRIAGVKTLIMSLWSVEDQATRQWMSALYQTRFVDELGTAEAMRSASLKMLNQRREQGETTHPYLLGTVCCSGRQEILASVSYGR